MLDFCRNRWREIQRGEKTVQRFKFIWMSSHTSFILPPHVRVDGTILKLSSGENDTKTCRKTGRKLTSSTVSGMHILYSFSNIFPPLTLRVSCVYSQCVKNQPSKMFPLRRPTGCVWYLWSCQRMWKYGEPGLRNTPQVTEFFHRKQRTLSGRVRDSRNELGSGLSPPITLASQASRKQRRATPENRGFKASK